MLLAVRHDSIDPQATASRVAPEGGGSAGEVRPCHALDAFSWEIWLVHKHSYTLFTLTKYLRFLRTPNRPVGGSRVAVWVCLRVEASSQFLTI